jgi:hypothetical protein
MADNPESLARHDIEAKIVKRCWEDEAFRQEFAADPVAAAVKYLEVPADMLPQIVVHEETPGSWHIVLPGKPDNSGELSDAELEKLAGGATHPDCVTWRDPNKPPDIVEKTVKQGW